LCKPFILIDKKTIGDTLDRSEAVTYLKELLSQCNDLSPESVSFETPINSNPIEYRIRESNKQSIREIAKKHSLSVQEDPNGVAIYKPKLQI
jgi:hypothetical protein